MQVLHGNHDAVQRTDACIGRIGLCGLFEGSFGDQADVGTNLRIESLAATQVVLGQFDAGELTASDGFGLLNRSQVMKRGHGITLG